MTRARTLLHWLSALNGFVSNLGLWLAATLIGVMAVLVATQVFFRYVLNNSLSWAEDLSLMLLVWSSFLIIPYAYRKSLHVGIDLLIPALPGRFRHATLFVSGALIVALAVYFIGVSWDFTTRSTIWANAVPIQMKYVYAIMPVSFALLLPCAFELEIRALLGLRDPKDPDAELPQAQVEG